MKETFVLDASALIAFLNDEAGASKVQSILQKASDKKCNIYMNKVNLLEIYYGVYREDGKEMAEETLDKISNLPIAIVDKLNEDVFKEAGRLKASHKMSLADSIALAEAKSREAHLITSDHHEFDAVEKAEKIKFSWIR